MTQQDILQAALSYAHSGLSVIPTGKDKLPEFNLLPRYPDTQSGEMKPTWEPFTQYIADDETLNKWFGNGCHANIAVVAGMVSGGLCNIDFDEARFYPTWKQNVKDLANGLVVQRTGKGFHVMFRCPDPGENRKLAYVIDDTQATGRRVAIETRGNGGYFLIAPSIHSSGKRYEIVEGDITNIPLISQAQANALLQAAIDLDEAPYTKQQLEAQARREESAQPKARPPDSDSAIHAYNQITPIEHILQENGYKARGSRFVRPNGKSASVAIKDGKSFHHSSNDPLCDGYWHDSFDVYCTFTHGGNVKEAVKTIAKSLGMEYSHDETWDNIEIPAEFVRDILETQPNVSQNAPAEISDLAKKLLYETHDHEGHAKCTILLFPNRFTHSRTHGWMYYNDKYWKRENAEAKVDRAIVKTLSARRVYAQKTDNKPLLKITRLMRENVSGAKTLLSSRVTVDIEFFDDHPNLLNCNNGVLNLQTGELTPHNPSQLFTYAINTNYNPNADSSPWLQFLTEAVNGNQELIDYLQMSLGYSLTGHTKEEIMYYVFGPSRSGKGTFTETIMKLLGRPLAVETDFATFTAERKGDNQNFDLAPLKPCRFVAASESNKNIPLNPAKVKYLTGGNYIRCAFKYGDHFEYKPMFKIWLSSNHPVNVDVDDNAAWGRVRVIDFPNSHLGKEDKNLKEKLSQPAVLEGVLAWIVEGARQWYQSPTGLPFPECVKASTQKQRDSLDYIQQFIDEEMEVSGEPKVFEATGNIHTRYENWCDANGVKPKYINQFTQALVSKGFETGKELVMGVQKRVIYGMRFKPIEKKDEKLPF